MGQRQEPKFKPHASGLQKFQSHTATINPDPNPEANSDTRVQELKQFDESKIGVKGLVDRVGSSIPSFFVHPIPPGRPNPNSSNSTDPKPNIPVIDFSSPRSTIVEQVRRPSSSLGFFQIINHSIPLASINKIVNSMEEFYELPDSSKMQYHSRDMS